MSAPPATLEDPAVLKRERNALVALCMGNLICGAGIQAPAGMIAELAAGFGVEYQDIGILMWAGSLSAGLGAPFMAWATTWMDRRTLLALSFGLFAASHLVAMLATSFWLLVLSRILVALAASIITPQAAAAAGLMVPAERRTQAVAFVLVGWSMAAACAAPVVKLIAAYLGWHEVMAVIALGALAAGWAVWRRLPPGLSGVPISFSTWIAIARRPAMVGIILTTMIVLVGIQIFVSYVVPVLDHLLQAGPTLTALLLGLQGGAGFAGAALASRYGARVGTGPGFLIATFLMIAGLAVLAVCGGLVTLAALGILLFGLGLYSSTAMQHARLVGLAPAMASASIALNTSLLYVGAAGGAWLGGLVVERDVGLVTWSAAATLLIAFLCGVAMLRLPGRTGRLRGEERLVDTDEHG